MKRDLPRGIRIDHGYVQIRLFHDGKPYFKNFGKDCDLARKLAKIHLEEKRKEILMGSFGVEKPLPEKTFDEVAEIYYDRWSSQKLPDGTPKRTWRAKYTVRWVLDKVLKPEFGKNKFHTILPKDVLRWRERRTEQVAGTTANREQVVLSSLFTHIEKWVKLEVIPAFRLPPENPCGVVEKAKVQKRSRVVTSYEIAKLKNAARELGDHNAAENIGLLVKTCLSPKDARKLGFGDVVNLDRAKTGVPVNIPITVLHTPDWRGWKDRWRAIREKAGLLDVQERDLRKAGGNLLVGEFDIKLVSQYMGHADQRTTESFYTKVASDKMAPLARRLSEIVDGL